MQNEIYLYDGIAPGSENVDLEERTFEEEWESHYTKRLVSDVSRPSLIPFIPEKPNGAAVMVVPGGGYRRLVINQEGDNIALWLNSLGIAAFVLKHRMPCDGHEDALHVPLEDARRGIRTIRARAEEYGLHSNNIGVMGFSAGGHVAATLGTHFNRAVDTVGDDIDRLSARPDFLALIYPVISIAAYEGRTLTEHQKARFRILETFAVDEHITNETPETFLLVADDDQTTPSENSVQFYLGLRKAEVPAELHIYKRGGHGFGLGKTRGTVSGWTDLCADWLAEVISR